MSEARQNSGGPLLVGQCALILAAACVLGLLYNGLSPLRVQDGTARASAPALIATTAPLKPATVRTGVHNETLSLTLELPPAPAGAPGTARTSPPTPAPVPVANPPAPVVAPSVGPVIPALKWPEVKGLLDAGKIVLIDARLKANYDIGHIPGAVLLPATSTAEELRAFSEKYPKPTAFVTYCGSESCHMSHQLAELLVKICGFTNVSHMPGGYAEYTIASANTK